MGAFGEIVRIMTYTPQSYYNSTGAHSICHWFCKYKDTRSTAEALARGEVRARPARAVSLSRGYL